MADVLADGVVALHGAYVAYVVVGGFVAWIPRLRWTWVLHAAAVSWGIALVGIGLQCPLTSLERWLRERDGRTVHLDGFVDRFLQGHLFPESATAWVRAAVAVLVIGSWVGLVRRSRATA